MTSNAVTSSQAVICLKVKWIYSVSKTVSAQKEYKILPSLVILKLEARIYVC
jgi:hypothetical protein